MQRKNVISHREKKNGASREAWQKRKAAANDVRGKQIFVQGIYSRVI